MSNDRDSISFQDLRHGVEFLVDFYKLFGVSREQVEQNVGVIKARYRDLAAKYHPDKYQHLAETFQAQTVQVYRHVLLGFETLSDASKRAAYDKQLSEWKGPISDNGFPVYDPQFYADLRRLPLTDKQIEEAEEVLGHLTGYDADDHAVLAKQVSRGSTDPQLLRAMDRSLHGKEILRAVQEHLYWGTIGIRKKIEGDGNTPAGYLEQVKSELAAARQQIPEQAQTLLLQARSGQIKLLGSGEDKTTELLADPAQGIQTVTTALTKEFDVVAPKIEWLAAEQEALREKRLELLSGEYQPPQRRFHPNLIICLDGGGERKSWFAFKMIKADTCSSDESVTNEQMQALTDPVEAKRWIRRGYNIMVLKVRGGIDVKDQLQEAVMKHYDSYRVQQKK